MTSIVDSHEATMASLIESQGYAPDELRSLLSWMLRDKTLVQDENHLFYWYYVLRAQTIKSAHLLLKSVLEDHAEHRPT